MFNLVKKDLKLATKINIFAVIYALFISGMGMSQHNFIPYNALYILGIIMLVFISVIYCNGYDDKNKSEVVLNSLPIDRVDIVRGKYMTLIILTLINCAFIMLFTNVIKMLGLIPDGIVANIWDVISAMSLLLVFYSIYYPFYFKLGNLRMFNAILWMLVFIGPTILSKIGKRFVTEDLIDKLASLNLKQIGLLVFIFSIVMYYISLQISKKMYISREF